MNKFILLILSYSCLFADLAIDGNGGILSLSPTSSIEVRAASKLTLQNVTLTGVNASTLHMWHGTSRIVLQSSKLILDDNYSFSQGSIEVSGDSAIEGEFTFTFSGHNLVIRPGSELCLGRNLEFVCTPTSRIRFPIVFQDDTSKLRLNNCTFKNNNEIQGIVFTNGQFITVTGDILLWVIKQLKNLNLL